MKLSIIVAMSDNHVIGKNNKLPWHLPEDLKRFKDITHGHTVIMGRKTFEAIGKPLPGRLNIVLSSNPDYRVPKDVLIASSVDNAVDLASNSGAEEAFFIGGTAVFEEALDWIDYLYLTVIHKKFAGDAYFPDFDLGAFDISKRITRKSVNEPSLSYSFIDAERRYATK